MSHQPVNLRHQMRLSRRHHDPLSVCTGKTLVWKNIKMTLAGKGKDDSDRKVLDDAWGEVPSTRTTAIMGPSGAGKTCLLNILAGRARSHGRVTIQSDVRINNYRVDPTNIRVRKHIAFVAQDASLQVTSTPREAIRFSAKLRLSREISEHDLDELTEQMITELGLTSCANTIVGGMLIKGISGGERKRTSVGVELVVKPALVFLDEPTSGLDSYSAVKLCQFLKKVANNGASVLFTIHQPSSEIFQLFDHLIFLNKGRVMYQGSVSDVPDFFARCGHFKPPNYNPADWIMHVAQSSPIDKLDKSGFFPKDDRIIGDALIPKLGKDELAITVTRWPNKGKDYRDERSPGMGTQVSLLFQRELKNLQRDVTLLVARFGLTTFLGVLVGFVFYNVGASNSAINSNLQSHFGAIIMLLVMSMFGTAMPTLLSFPEERPVFLREYSTNHYSTVAYFISRFSVEATITALHILWMLLIQYFMIDFQGGFFMFFGSVYTLAMASTALAVLIGCSVEDSKLGQEMLPLPFVPQMLFAGFFVTPDMIPAWVRWARYLCTLTYAVRILLVAEFEDCANGDGSEEATRNCKFLLESIEAYPSETWWNWSVLVALFAVFRLLALAVLWKKATKLF